jgi:peptidoglycan/xylan/chitin deacetylase (PgdA/CDA1 family)
VGDNVRKYPAERDKVLQRGHVIGNHTFHHLRGLNVSAEEYAEDIALAEQRIASPLFRPPHGFMSPRQYKYAKEHYRIVMWDVVTRDYSKRLNGEQVFRIVQRYTRPGSILTFHDSLKAERNLHYALPRAIEWLMEQGYTFHKIK